jgi:adenosylhomocysteine nucleosidase
MISSGFAGALKPELQAGIVIAPEKTRTLKNHANVDSDAPAREAAIRQGACPIQNLITMDRLVKTAEEKSRLAFFGEAVDMESAIVMSRFAREGVPALALRAISDVAGEDLPLDFDRCLTPQGAIKPLNLVNQIVRRPGNLPEIVRFGKQSLEAGQKMALFLEKFLTSIPTLVERLAHA